MGIENKFTTPPSDVSGLEDMQEQDVEKAIAEGQEVLGEILENNENKNEDVEKGESFLKSVETMLQELVQTFFSLPESGKFKNIILKVFGAANIAMWTKVAMDQRFNDIFTSSSDREKLAIAALAIGLGSATPYFLTALDQQFKEKRKNPDYKY